MSAAPGVPSEPEEISVTAAGTNTLSFRHPVDPAVFARVDADLLPRMRAVEGFDGLHVVRTGDTEVILIIPARDVETLDRLATELGSPWMVASIVPLLAGPPDRRIGPTLVSTDR